MADAPFSFLPDHLARPFRASGIITDLEVGKSPLDLAAHGVHEMVPEIVGQFGFIVTWLYIIIVRLPAARSRSSAAEGERSGVHLCGVLFECLHKYYKLCYILI